MTARPVSVRLEEVGLRLEILNNLLDEFDWEDGAKPRLVLQDALAALSPILDEFANAESQARAKAAATDPVADGERAR